MHFRGEPAKINNMAIYSSTLLIKGNLNISDSEFLKLLALDVSVTSYDKHRIGKENSLFDEIIPNLNSNNDEVYVSSKDNYTVIVSFALIDDYSRSIGLLKNRIEKLFPESEYFFFFSETISMLNGFVWGVGNKILRKKYVQNGKYVEVYDHTMDIGNLLQEEKDVFTNKNDYVDGFPIKNNDYMFGAFDFNIASSFIERIFHIESLGEYFSSLTFNRNIHSGFSAEELDAVNNKLQASEIVPEILNTLKPLMKTLKFKKIDFKESGQRKKSNGFYKLIEGDIKIVVEANSSSFHGSNSASLNLYVQYNNDLYRNIVESMFPGSILGIKFYTVDFTFELCRLNKTETASINNRKELNYLINRLEEKQPVIKDIIEKASNKDLVEFFSDKTYFEETLRTNLEILEYRQHIYPNAGLNYCLTYHYLNNNQHIADEILKVVDLECKHDLFIGRHNKTKKMVKEAISNNLKRKIG